MEPVTIEHIEEQLRQLPPGQLALVSKFISKLTRQQEAAERQYLLQIAETSLRKDWDRPEEEAAWAHL